MKNSFAALALGCLMTISPIAALAQGLAGASWSDLVIEELRQNVEQYPEEARIKVEFAAPEGEAAQLRDFNFDRQSGRFVASVVDMRGSTQRIGGRVTATIEVLLPSRRLAPGEIISDGDLHAVEIPVQLMARDSYFRPEDLVGMQVKRAIVANRPIMATSLQAPLLVERGDDVEIVYQQAGMRLTAQGRALSDGALGEEIRVLNLASRQQVAVEVMAAGEVRSVLAPK